MSDQIDVAVRTRAQLGEGPRWIDRQLRWVDITGHRLHRFDPATGVDDEVEVDEDIGMVAPRAGGGLLAALGRSVVLYDADLVEVERIALPDEPPTNRVNDGRCDPGGRLWIGTMQSDAEGRAGSLYRLDADGTVTRWEDGLGISNGLDWSPDGALMYHIDTPTGRVDVYDYDVEEGVAATRRPLLEVAPGDGHPDGMAVDTDGCLWVALYDGWAVRRYTPKGRLDHEVRLPVAKPTAVAFGGEDLTDLYITTATEGLDEAALSEQPLAGSLLRVRPGAQGVAARPFAG